MRRRDETEPHLSALGLYEDDEDANATATQLSNGPGPFNTFIYFHYYGPTIAIYVK